MIIRRAEKNDINGINTLLYQVNNVHADGRSDIFIHNKKKYTDEELLQIINDDSRPIYVAEDDEKYENKYENDENKHENKILGYAFCIYEKPQNENLKPIKTMYIDDICVLENERGKHIGTEIYNYVRNVALQNGCYHITLNVWTLNKGAMNFYEKCGLSPLKITMEDILSDRKG